MALLHELTPVGGPRYERIAELYAQHFLAHEEYPAWAMEKEPVWDVDAP